VRGSTVARNYAEALFELGERHAAHDSFAQSVATLAELLESDRRIRQFLEIPKIEASAKKQAVREALTGKVAPLFLNFVLVVIDNRRQRLLREIGHEYRALLDEKLGRLHVQVTLAHPADAATEQRIAAELGRILGRAAIPHIVVDPSILGGIVVRYGDQVMDGSVKRRLQSLRNRLMDAALPATAS
jgi:F-type H+-transporting ATPase subunit delta